MTDPQTNYELAGEWTTLAQETAFLDRIVAETDLTEAIAGYSVQDRPIRYFTLGTGAGKTIFLLALVHGNEPASREAMLAMIRDLAYSTDPDVVAYLAQHRVVFMPNGNPDGTLIRRVNAAGVDPNRDRFRALQPETQAVLKVINETSPLLLVDCHEYFSSGDDWRGLESHMASSHASVRHLEAEVFQAAIDLMHGLGHTASAYPLSATPRACTSGYGSSRHIVSLTSETNALHGDIHTRVSVQRIFLDMLLDWFGDNAAACSSAQAQSLQWARSSLDPDRLMIREQYVGRDTPEVAYIEGYQLREILPQRLIDLHGIEVGEDGFVSMFQDARMVIPQILDPAAMDRQVEAVRVLRAAPGLPREPLPSTQLIGIKVRVDGAVCEVIGIRHQIDGRPRDILLPGEAK